MLSLLMPRFGQDDNKTMPSSSAAFPLQFPPLVAGRLSGDNENGPVEFFIKHQQQQQQQQQQHTPTSTHSSSSIKDEINDEKRGSSISPSISVDGSYACSQCSALFQNRDQFEKHELMHSPNPQQSVCCKKCNKSFANVYRLQRHMISHDESDSLRKFKCSDCDKAFKFKHHLKEHIRIHSGEKPFGCRNCGKRFSHSGSYSSHMTSKKCISAGLKLNRSAKVDKAAAQKRTPFPQLPNVNNVGLGVGLNLSDNNNLANSPNNNAFLSQMIPKYANYDALAQLAFSNLPNPFLMMNTHHHIHSIQSLLGLTGTPPGVMDSILNSAHHHNKTPSLHSDPEDMIEEVTDDINDEAGKLVMDIDGDDSEHKLKMEHMSPSPQISVSSIAVSSPRSNFDRNDLIKREDSRSENGFDNNELTCGRCNETFNHRTELAQHETILCGMIRKQEEAYAAAQAHAAAESLAMNANFGMNGLHSHHSGSEDERKVRVRTAISEDQQNVLKDFYAKNPKPGREEFRTIAQILSLDSRVVQVWFQNNRSRERKLNNIGYGKQHLFGNGQLNEVKTEQMSTKIPLPVPLPQSILTSQLSPKFSRSPVANTDDQPLDLSVKKDGSMSTPSSSPRYGTAPLPSEEVINLSRKSRSHFPYVPPLGYAPLDRFINIPEMARNNLMSDSLSPGIDKQRNWKDDLPFGKDTFNGHVSPKQPLNQPAPSKRSYNKQPVPEGDGQYVCDACDKAFNKQSSLARHKYEHSGQRPYKCQDCTKAFKHKHHLTEHNRLHTGEKPFQCTKCLKRFSHSGSYSQHMNHRYSYCKPYREA